MQKNRTLRQRGGALLAVLWVSAALSAIAFSVAITVRGETERAGTLSEGVRSYYLATGAIERMMMYIQWGPGHRNPDGSPRFFEPGVPRYRMQFPTGTADVELIPEGSKLGLNESRPEDLFRLLTVLGVDPARAQEITMAIVDWRGAVPGGLSSFDQYYLSLTPSFRARHSSFEEIEELLLVKGMTPDLFYGTLVRDAQGRLQPRAGLRDCVSVYGTSGVVDANTAQPAVLAAIGLPPEAVAAIVQRRHALPFRNMEELAPFMQMAGPGAARLTIGGGTILTLRATARLRLPDGRSSDLMRTVSAVYKFHQEAVDTPPIELLRWYDN
jgi:general secretion pathway protein K